MRKTSKAIGGLVAALGIVGMTATTASAAPPESFDLMCGDVTYVITSANGQWAIGNVVGSSTHFIPYALHFVGTDESGAVLFDEAMEKKGNAHQNQSGHLTCTFTDTVSTGEGVIYITGTASVVVRP